MTRAVPQPIAPSWRAFTDACRGIGHQPVFQPIVDVARGVVAGYESLVRFDAPPRNPELWFETARKRGCEADLEAAVLRAALQWRAQLPPNCFLSLNVSPTALASEAVRSVWRDQGDLGGLVIELTEQTCVESYADLARDLTRLRTAGALIAVDDAGSGYAGLRHLLQVRPSIIKLDRELVSDVDRDESKRALIEMLGTFAGRIDAWLLAEGIERAAELDTIAALGVPLAQGFFLGRPGLPWTPVDPDAAVRLVSRAGADAHATTLHSQLVVAPAVHCADAAKALVDVSDVVVLLDPHDRPIAVLRPGDERGDIRAGLRMHADTSLAEAAARAMTRSAADRFAPLMCTDDQGRYVGIVRMERLVSALATTA
jgi:EAL domain-containing protein (putative c-di-GMP-specific phosphodiesterase class I)